MRIKQLLLDNGIIFFTLFFCFENMQAQCIIETIEKDSPLKDSINQEWQLTYQFPVVFHPIDSVQHKINKQLLHRVLIVEDEPIQESIFEQIMITAENYSGSYHLHFEEIANTQNLLSLRFVSESCGAYCESYFFFENFDLRNGNEITLENLFTEEGLTTFEQTVFVWHQNEMNAKIEATQKLLENTNDESEIERYNEIIHLYRSCLKRRDHIYIRTFSITENNNINVYIERCSRHFDRALDELEYKFYSIDSSEIGSLLSEYGKELLSDQ